MHKAVRRSSGSLGSMAVYTAITGAYDDYVEPPVHDAYDAVLFSDQSNDPAAVSVQLPESWPRLDDSRRSRFFKAVPNRVLGEYPVTFWIDASIRFWQPLDLHALADRCLRQADIAFFSFPTCDCAYKAAEICQKMRLDDPDLIQRQVDRYRREGFPADLGMVMGGFIFRRNTPDVIRFNELWWSEIENGTKRDQISLNYALWKSRIVAARIPGYITDYGMVISVHRDDRGRVWNGES